MSLAPFSGITSSLDCIAKVGERRQERSAPRNAATTTKKKRKTGILKHRNAARNSEQLGFGDQTFLVAPGGKKPWVLGRIRSEAAAGTTTLERRSRHGNVACTSLQWEGHNQHVRRPTESDRQTLPDHKRNARGYRHTAR